MILFFPLVAAQTTPASVVDYGIPVAGDFTSEGTTSGNRYRERDYGVGYGTSSGYASGRSYTDRGTQSYFRCG
ncbi:MAG: hypothetical protein SGI99_03420 [Pseudomonadota bacterium]|nr:hypothetical protein [Pseudomonadota bacterium]